MSSRALLLILLLASTIPTYAEEPFSVSLWSSSADLSPYYRAVIREATERYRGDGFATIVLGRVYYFTLSTGEVVRIEEAHFDSDPFPAELFTLRSNPLASHDDI